MFRGRFYILFFLFFVASVFGYSFHSYDLYYVGAKGSSLGGAYVSLADEPSAIFWNPAGLVQQTKPTISYLLDTQFFLNSLRDPLYHAFKVTYKTPALLSYVHPLNNKYNMVFGFGAMTPIQRKIDSAFYVVQIGPSFAFMPFKNFSFGAGFGYLISSFGFTLGGGWGFQLGALYKMNSFLRLGAVYRSGAIIKWSQIRVEQTFPSVAQIGATWKLSPTFFLLTDLEYQDWSKIRFIDKGIDKTPNIQTGLFYSILPHLGMLIVDENSGAHFRFGLLNHSFLDAGSHNIPQWNLTFGIGGRAVKNVYIEAGLRDSYIVGLFYDQEKSIETIQGLVNYKFE